MYKNLTHFSCVIKYILNLFHGLSQFEGGVSFNKALMNNNMQKKTLFSRCLVRDFMQTHKLKAYEVKITIDFQNSVLFAQEHYWA